MCCDPPPQRPRLLQHFPVQIYLPRTGHNPKMCMSFLGSFITSSVVDVPPPPPSVRLSVGVKDLGIGEWERDEFGVISVGVGVLLCLAEGVGLGERLSSPISGSGVGVQSDQLRPANSRNDDIIDNV